LHNEDGVISILNNWEGGVNSLRKRGQKNAKIILPADDTLKEISGNCKKKWGEMIPYLTPLVHLKSFPAVPLRSTEEVAVDNSSSIYLNHFGGKPLACSISKMVECSTRSKAFSKSSFRIIISLLEW
jgi:hypothetical protein